MIIKLTKLLSLLSIAILFATTSCEKDKEDTDTGISCDIPGGDLGLTASSLKEMVPSELKNSRPKAYKYMLQVGEALTRIGEELCVPEGAEEDEVETILLENNEVNVISSQRSIRGCYGIESYETKYSWTVEEEDYTLYHTKEKGYNYWKVSNGEEIDGPVPARFSEGDIDQFRVIGYASTNEFDGCISYEELSNEIIFLKQNQELPIGGFTTVENVRWYDDYQVDRSSNVDIQIESQKTISYSNNDGESIDIYINEDGSGSLSYYGEDTSKFYCWDEDGEDSEDCGRK